MNTQTIKASRFWHRTDFRSQCIYWSAHAFFCAAPSFFIAFAAGFNSAKSIGAMFLGIATFVCFYALVSSRDSYVAKTKNSQLGSAIRLGAKLRCAVSLLGVLGFVGGAVIPATPRFLALFIVPDFYAGMLAMWASEWLWETSMRVPSDGYNPNPDFLFTYTTTVIEGAIITATFLVLSAICYCVGFIFKKLRR